MRTLRSLTRAVATVAVVPLVLLAACSTEAERAAEHAVDPAGQPAVEAPEEMPSAVPAAQGRVATRGLMTVLDSGKGAQLCAMVADSFPPQCSGLPLEGWDWAAHPEHESASGVRWGDFHVTGTFDGETLTVEQVIPAALYDGVAPEPVGDDFASPCPEPAGGWVVVDAAKATQETMDATLAAASALPAYATAWLDQSINPASTSDDPAVQESQMNDPTKLILNVAVTGDPAAAEAKLRETWGGMLCVSQAKYTEAELQAVAEKLNALPGLISSGSSDVDQVEVAVWHDDGTIQAWADEEFGEGMVVVSSALEPDAG